MKLTFRQLHYFVAIVDAGSMNRAACRLHLAPTALSLQVRGMEERLGVELLERSARGVTPTLAGAALLLRARELLASLERVEHEVAALGSPEARTIRLGVPPSAARLVGADVMLRAEALGSTVALQLREGFSADLVGQLDDGALDFVLGCELGATPEHEVIDLLEEQLLFFSARDEASETGAVPLETVLRAPLAYVSDRDACWRLLLAAAEAAGLPAPRALRLESMNTIRQFIVRGRAVAVAGYGTFREECRRGEVSARAIAGAPLRRRTSLSWSRGRRIGVEDERFIGMMFDVVQLMKSRIGPSARLLAGAPRA